MEEYIEYNIPSTNTARTYETIYPSSINLFIDRVMAQSTLPFSGNLSEYLFSIRTYPFRVGHGDSPVSSVPIGRNEITATDLAIHKTNNRIALLRICRFQRQDAFGWEYGRTGEIYLPYIGTYSVELTWLIAPSYLDIVYCVDLVTGKTTAFLWSDGKVVATYEGQVGEDAYYSINNAAQVAKNVVGSVVAAGIGMVVAPSPSTAVSGISGIAAAANQPVRQVSGSIGSTTSGREGPQMPYIILHSPPPMSNPSQFRALYGAPCGKTKILRELTGYTEISQIHLDGVGRIYSGEREELEGILKSGVIL